VNVDEASYLQQVGGSTAHHERVKDGLPLKVLNPFGLSLSKGISVAKEVSVTLLGELVLLGSYDELQGLPYPVRVVLSAGP